MVGDLDADGHQDLAVADFDVDTLSILRGNGDGSFQDPRSFSTGVFPSGVALGDFNGDGAPDVATTSEFDNTVSVLLSAP